MNVPKKKPNKTQSSTKQKSDTSVIKIDLRRTFNTWNEMSEIIFNMTSLPQDIYTVFVVYTFYAFFFIQNTNFIFYILKQ